MNAQTQSLTLQGGAGAIEALIDEPQGDVQGVAVLAHPHPLFGGAMTNKVVQTLARACVQAGWRAPGSGPVSYTHLTLPTSDLV